MHDLSQSILSFHIASDANLPTLQTRLQSVAASRFEWQLRESHYEGSYLKGAIPGDSPLWKVRIFQEDDGFEVEVCFNSRSDSVLGADELQARSNVLAEVKALLEAGSQ